MKQWQEKDLKFLLNSEYFPECIECGNIHFHKVGCTRGASNFELTNVRLNERLAKFEEQYGEDGIGIQCKECGKRAWGMMHIFYHGTETTVESWPVCMAHAYHEDSVGRETRFIAFK